MWQGCKPPTTNQPSKFSTRLHLITPTHIPSVRHPGGISDHPFLQPPSASMQLAPVHSGQDAGGMKEQEVTLLQQLSGSITEMCACICVCVYMCICVCVYVYTPVMAITFSCAAIHFSSVYNLQRHQRPLPLIPCLYGVGG